MPTRLRTSINTSPANDDDADGHLAARADRSEAGERRARRGLRRRRRCKHYRIVNDETGASQGAGDSSIARRRTTPQTSIMADLPNFKFELRKSERMERRRRLGACSIRSTSFPSRRASRGFDAAANPARSRAALARDRGGVGLRRESGGAAYRDRTVGRRRDLAISVRATCGISPRDTVARFRDSVPQECHFLLVFDDGPGRRVRHGQITDGGIARRCADLGDADVSEALAKLPNEEESYIVARRGARPWSFGPRAAQCRSWSRASSGHEFRLGARARFDAIRRRHRASSSRSSSFRSRRRITGVLLTIEPSRRTARPALASQRRRMAVTDLARRVRNRHRSAPTEVPSRRVRPGSTYAVASARRLRPLTSGRLGNETTRIGLGGRQQSATIMDDFSRYRRTVALGFRCDGACCLDR